MLIVYAVSATVGPNMPKKMDNCKYDRQTNKLKGLFTNVYADTYSWAPKEEAPL